MNLKQIGEKDKTAYNAKVTHIMQSWEWGEFRKDLGTKLKRYGLYQNGQLVEAFQVTFHKIPLTNLYIGYLPKGPFPSEELAQALAQIGKDENCAFIKTEPNILATEVKQQTIGRQFKISPKPLFTKYNFVLDLTPSEDEILKKMHPKTRYNIKVAQKRGVTVEEHTDDEAFELFLKLHFDTTQRQGFYSHTPYYHHTVWEKLKKFNMVRLLIAFYQPPNKEKRIPVNSWALMSFHDTLYYPYGGSSDDYKNVMAPVLTAWEAIKLGKKMQLKKFDLWGAANPKLGSSDPYWGFTRFKEGLGGELVEYLDTYDLIFNRLVYLVIIFIERFSKIKVLLLKILGR